MPVPKDKEELYGKIAGHMQNEGKSLAEAKNIADKAVGIGSSKKGDSNSKCKVCGKKHEGNWHS